MRATGARRAAPLVLAVVGGLLLAACSSSGSSSPTPVVSGVPASPTSASGAATSAATTSAPASASATSATASASATSATTPSPKRTRDPALVGIWHADAASILAATLGRGSLRSLTACTGPVVLTFTAQGTVTDQGQITCTGRGPTGHGQFNSIGRYAADGSTLLVTEAVTRCTLSVAGTAVPCTFGYGDGTASYRVSSARLTLTFTTPTGTRTQTYTR